MAKSDLERKAEQIREQIEDLRVNLDDVLRNYNKLVAAGADWFTSAQGQVSRAARQAKGNVAEVGEELAELSHELQRMGAGQPALQAVADTLAHEAGGGAVQR